MFNLVRSGVSEADAAIARHLWPLQIVATSSETNLPAAIFVFQVEAPGAGLQENTFSCVASAAQLGELPSAAEEGIPFYLQSEVLFWARSADHANEAWIQIQAAVQQLADNIASAELLSEEDSVTITPNIQ